MALTSGKIPKASSGNVVEDGYDVVTTVGATGDDTSIPTEQGVREALNDKIGGAGAVVDNRIVTFDGTSGGSIQQSPASVDDNGYAVFGDHWDDVQITPGAFQFAGVADPTLVNYQPGGSGTNFKLYEFAASDEVHFTAQLPHGYVEGTDISPHVHWTPGPNGTTESGNTVAWKIDYSIISVNGNFAASSNIDLTDACDGTDHKHQIAEGSDVAGAGLEVSAVLLGRLYRDTGDTWAGTATGSLPMLVSIDIHVKKDTIGSDAEVTKT